jgi:hypothetical protein
MIRRDWRHSAFRRFTSRVYRRLTLETETRPDHSNLSLLSRRGLGRAVARRRLPACVDC